MILNYPGGSYENFGLTQANIRHRRENCTP